MSSKRGVKRQPKALEEDAYCENESKSNGDSEDRREEDQSTQTSHVDKVLFRQAWVRAIQRTGTTKLPKKSWMNTHCMKLNSNLKYVQVIGHGHGHRLATVMMCGTSVPHKQREKDAVDSICRTTFCIVPDHHRWLLKSEKSSRECCGDRLMCCICHLEIPLPCSHKPPCQWKVISNSACSDCKRDADQDEVETVGSNKQSSTNLLMRGISNRSAITSNDIFKSSEENAKRKRNSKGEEKEEVNGNLHASNGMSHMDNELHKAWIRMIQNQGTTKLPRKPWMKTHCMKLNSNQAHVGALGSGRLVSTVMMRGTNMPGKQYKQATLDSVCRTLGCIIPNHHRWMSKEEKWSRQSCGASLMCPACHVEIPLPCSHDPPCRWRSVSKEKCSACKSQE
ncbi:hypothetical protein SEMRO_1706_G292510.1 [Seminavis robusta]|uniref:Uncharacterized protein n=1 Tax=Seminavis robusta TaxID=568900 RepID=A0A9N8EVT0_9STRA|nr:hypothetical protein SEMRO_1706_G292510.1 [Seminavis robusta]|eukprot:Sro1706_g292510.1 n/a (394) ;mRNA; r:9870-11051